MLTFSAASATIPRMDELAAQFEARLRDAIRQCVALGYHPRRFEEMLNTMDAVATAKHLIASGDLQEGLQRLAKMNRPDLSLEAIMLEEKFKPLFTPGELAAADWRLKRAMRGGV